jgi:hypothetical protein
MEEDVRMAFDEAGEQRRARKIDDGCAGHGDRHGRTGGLDALILHPHGPALVHRLAVEDARGTDDNRGRGAWLRCRALGANGDLEEQDAGRDRRARHYFGMPVGAGTSL